MGKGGGFDFKQVRELQKQLEKIQKENDKFCEACSKYLAARLLAKVVKRTPVGQYPAGTGQTGGTLRRGWTVGEMQKSEGNYIVEIINPMEYTSYVEFGHRTVNHAGWVPGRFMLTISERELQAQAPALIEKKIAEHLRRHLDV